jgi:hypothetical protein
MVKTTGLRAILLVGFSEERKTARAVLGDGFFGSGDLNFLPDGAGGGV